MTAAPDRVVDGPAVDALVGAVRAALADAADPGRAGAMQAYMKSALPFRGVPRPVRAGVEREVLAAYPLPSRASWEGAVRDLWDGAAYREERYVAVTLTGWKAYRRWLDLDAVPLLEKLVVEGAWWDYVDEVATRRLGPLLRADPEGMRPLIRSWAVDEDPWKRRAAVVCQVGARDRVDLDLLADCLVPNLGDRGFFLRKGVGWALRDAARENPRWVRAFVRTHDARISALSRREAMKHLGDPVWQGSPSPDRVTGE